MLGVSIRKNLPGLLHECPYAGLISVKDVNINEIISPIIPHVVPSGIYKASLLFSKLNQPNLTYGQFELTAEGDAIDIMKRMTMG